jgi:hypothetical protein
LFGRSDTKNAAENTAGCIGDRYVPKKALFFIRFGLYSFLTSHAGFPQETRKNEIGYLLCGVLISPVRAWKRSSAS